MKSFLTFSRIKLLQLGCRREIWSPQRGSYICLQCRWWTTLTGGEIIYEGILKLIRSHLGLLSSGTPMALKFFPRQSTSLTSFLREYNLSLSYCTHPSLTRALGIFFSTPSYYVFAQQAGLYGDLYSVIVSEVSLADVWHERNYMHALLIQQKTYTAAKLNTNVIQADMFLLHKPQNPNIPVILSKELKSYYSYYSLHSLLLSIESQYCCLSVPAVVSKYYCII